MDKTQEEKAISACKKHADEKMVVPDYLWPEFKAGYEACLEANGIGEETKDKVELILAETLEAFAYSVTRFSHVFNESMKKGIERANEESRIPAWVPKDGEAVLFELFGPHSHDDTMVFVDTVGMAGVWSNGMVYYAGKSFNPIEMHISIKPFDASAIGKPWSEI